MIALDYLKLQLAKMAAIALGQRIQSVSNVVVSVRTKATYVLMEAKFTEVVYEAFGTKHVEVNMTFVDNDRNTDRLVNAGMKTSVLRAKYLHTDNMTRPKQYHTMRFAEQVA